MEINQISSIAQLNGFAPRTKKLVTIKGEKITGLCFYCNSIVKDKWLDFFKGLLGGAGYRVSYCSQQENINIDL